MQVGNDLLLKAQRQMTRHNKTPSMHGCKDMDTEESLPKGPGGDRVGTLAGTKVT